MRLTLLHFNDLHGRLEQLPRLFHLARRERAEAQAQGREVLLLDAGDSSDRGRWECEVTQGRATYSLLAAMGVTASVPGNGETLNWGRPALDKIVAAAGFPVLAANLADAAEGQPAAVRQPAAAGLRGSLRLELGGCPVGLIGLTQTFPEAFQEAGYAVMDPRAALRREIDSLRAQGAGLLILLSHLGLASQPGDALSGEWPNALHDITVAAEFPEIAVIVGGHSHSQLETPLTAGRTIIAQAGDKGRFLGRLDLEVEEATGRVTAFEGRLIACGPETPLDPTIQGTLELVEEEAGRVKNRV